VIGNDELRDVKIICYGILGHYRGIRMWELRNIKEMPHFR
jgi:hypothetical protein